MDKEYVLYTIRQRIEELKHRYKMLCHLKDEDGTEIKNKYTAAVKRTEAKRDLQYCLLVEELIVGTPGKLAILSEEATQGLERLMEPCERHRRLKNEV